MEKDITIGQIVAGDYRAAAVFGEYDIDFCCGGQKLLSDVCKEKGINSDDLIKKLEGVLLQEVPVQYNFNIFNMVSLVDHIVKVHHVYITRSLPDILLYTNKISDVHGTNHEELIEVARLFKITADELLTHLKKEEELIFPAIRSISDMESSSSAAMLSAELENLIEEHETAGSILAQIRKISGNYFVPEDGCNTWRLAYSMLENFENDLHMHVHLENNILFPKVSETIKNIK